MPAPALLHSSLLSHVPHAFATRRGGVSSGVFASLNFGNPSELPREQRDPPANIRANYELALAGAGCPGRELVEVHQVHGGVAHAVRRGRPAHASPADTRADAIVTDDPSRAAAIRVADCAPVLLADADGRVVAAVHAGWRGVIAGILPAAIGVMHSLGAADLRAAIGPCLGAEHFEVGPEVAAEFRRVFGARAPIRPRAGDRSMADLKAALALQARDAGVREIEVLPHCTFADPDLFFSHRRDRGVTGRMAAIISPRA